MKTCISCLRDKPLDDFGLYKRSKDGRTATCKTCRNSMYRARRDKNAERERYHQNKARHAEKRKLYRQRNSKEEVARVNAWREKNPEILKELRKRYQRKNVETAKDGYIKHLLKSGSSLRPTDIPQALIECKRLELKITRYVKEIL